MCRGLKTRRRKSKLKAEGVIDDESEGDDCDDVI